MRDLKVLPIPASLRDSVEWDVKKLDDASDRKWIARRLVERAYADGYSDGHLNGSRESREDAFDDQQAARNELAEIKRQFRGLMEEFTRANASDPCGTSTVDIPALEALREMVGLDREVPVSDD